jgi:hypothetical protein
MSPQLPRGKWPKGLLNRYGLFHILWFDPGSAGTGWAHIVLDEHAYSRPDNRVLANVVSWDCGTYRGSDIEQYVAAVGQMKELYHKGTFRPRMDVGSEDFDLVQTVGGKENLLSPVRFNAVMNWELVHIGKRLKLQNRALRTQQTAERLTAFGFAGRWSKTSSTKDEFAAMQHAVTYMRNLKQKANDLPWKLSDGVSSNARWDCACEETRTKRKKCDLSHPR